MITDRNNRDTFTISDVCSKAVYLKDHIEIKKIKISPHAKNHEDPTKRMKREKYVDKIPDILFRAIIEIDVFGNPKLRKNGDKRECIEAFLLPNDKLGATRMIIEQIRGEYILKTIYPLEEIYIPKNIRKGVQ